MGSQDKANELRGACGAVTATPIGNLVSRPDWGAINFEPARSDVDRIFSVCNLLGPLPLELLPDTEIDTLRSHVDACNVQVSAIRNFNLTMPNPVGTRDAIVQQIKGAADALYVQAQARLPFLALQRGDVRENEEAFAHFVQSAKKEYERSVEQAAQGKKEADGLLQAMRTTAAEAGVGVFSGSFQTSASQHQADAKLWLGVAGLLAALTVIVAFNLPSWLPSTISDHISPYDFSILTSKVIVLATMLTATLWAGRNYKASKHLATVNAHRRDALATFQAFVKAAGDDEQTRNAVLLETTRSIFAITSTGYIDGSEGSHDGPLRVLEVVKSATKVPSG